MRDPPQTCLSNVWRLACQGQLPAGAFSPPTILLLSGGVPHTNITIEIIGIKYSTFAIGIKINNLHWKSIVWYLHRDFRQTDFR
jgi:hypothetical protein